MKAEFINILNELKMNCLLMEEIDLETMLTLLKNYSVITEQEEHKLLSKGPIGGRYELVGTILPRKVDEYMEFFIQSLKIAKFTQSYEFVLTRVKNVGASGTGGVVAPKAGVAAGRVSAVNITSSDTLMKGEDPLMEAQKHLSKFLNLNVDSMADFWSGRLHLPSTCRAFVDVQILEDFKDDRDKVVHEYDEVFGAFNRILIQGDPGCGKSTYVNKIALDWAKNHPYLRDKFDLVFLISLQTLEVGIEQAIRNLLPQRSSTIEFVEDYYKSHSSKVLLIMDGFDKFPEDSQFYPEVMNIMKGSQTMFQYSFFTTIITTRRSHADKVPTRFHARSLLIKGFDEKSMKLFLQTQNVPIPNEEADPNFIVLLQNPFFCTIYCSLHYSGVDKSKLKYAYDFVKLLVAVKIEKETKGITNDGDQLQLLGAFSFEKLKYFQIFEFLTDEFRFICYCKSKSETPAINDITSLDCNKIDSEIGHDSRFFPTLAKCNQLKSLDLKGCNLSTHEAPEVVKLFRENCLPKLTKFVLSLNSNVGSTPALFAALGKCKQLETLDLEWCSLSIESINQLTTCIDDNCWVKLSQLALSGNSNVGSTPALFAALGKCKQLERLYLAACDLSIESINRLTTCIDDNCWVKFREIGLSDNSNVELSTCGQKAKKALLDRGCEIY